uniref:Uncharacterized protein n=1 Tax=Sinocyclocheilus rhinocerous TaxID=307959 RepID=A0A673JEY4_9TELE
IPLGSRGFRVFFRPFIISSLSELFQMVFLHMGEHDVNTQICFSHSIVLFLCFAVLPSNFSNSSFKYCVSSVIICSLLFLPIPKSRRLERAKTQDSDSLSQLTF